ncbi:MAG: hypothetical protein M3436_18545 [Pseudomonadota bacterium]|nr:hypothetical protein [Pseudomonadota bacterium]
MATQHRLDPLRELHRAKGAERDVKMKPGFDLHILELGRVALEKSMPRDACVAVQSFRGNDDVPVPEMRREASSPLSKPCLARVDFLAASDERH